jgi:hypothetical protein
MSIEEKGKGVKYVATWSVVGVEEDPSQFNNNFYLDSCLSSNTMSIVGWYVGSGASIHMTYDRSFFS